VSRETSLDRDLIDQAISTGGSAADQSWLAYFFSPLKVFVPEEDNLGPSERVGGVDPKATVSMHFSEQRYPLSEFEVELTAEGVSATIFTQKGATDIPHAFLIGDFEGEYFRRTTPDSYPLEMLFGPSVATIAANTPGLIERLQQDGRVELVKQVKRERDRIVNEFLAL
jgi:hypothetical protein